MPETSLAVEVESLVQRFSNYLQAMQKSPQTQAEYVKHVRRWFEWWQKPLKDFNSEAWDEYLYYETERGIAGRTIRARQSGLRKFFKFLRRNKIVTHNPSEDAESVGIRKTKPEFLSEAQIQAMFKAASSSKHDTALLECLYSCGLRNSELRSLPLENILPTHIRVMGKGSKERLIGITPRVYTSISAFLEGRNGHLYAFGWKKGARVAMVTVQRIVARLARSAGVSQRVTPHTLRHSIATHLALRGTPVESIQHFLGHESIETTMIYVHIAKSILSESILVHHPRS